MARQKEDIKVIEVKNLVKKFGDHYAVNDISFTVEPGKIYGLLGPNGAGKSTTMNIMTGYIGATSGQVLVNNYDIFEDAKNAKKYIGYLPEIPPLYMDMTVFEFLIFVAELKEVSKKERKMVVDTVMEQTKVTEMKDRLIKNLSKGYRQRVGLAQAIIGDPEVIILDEPTVGLDPIQIAEMRDLIRALGKNHTIILSSHILSEISEVCDHVFIISKGKLILSERAENLSLHLKTSQTLEIVAKGDKAIAVSSLENLANIASVTSQNGSEEGTVKLLVVAKDKDDIRGEVSMTLTEQKIAIYEMKEVGQSLEDVFLEMTTEENKKEA